MAKRHRPLTAFVFKPFFIMDTSNKIRVVDQDPCSLKRTHSGGVRDPSDPKHYPKLDGTEGAMGTPTSQRTLSKFGSFKHALVARPDMAKVLIGRDGSAGASPLSSPGSLLRTRRTDDMADALAIASPKIAAKRSFQEVEPARGGVGGAGEVGWSSRSQQAAADNQEDGFAQPSPKKAVTQAAQRRRTADEQAQEEKFHRDLAHPNKFAALADGGELSQEPLGEADDRQGSAGSRRPNSGDHVGPGTKWLVMAVAIPVLAGACMFGAGLVLGSHIMGGVGKAKTSILSWGRN